MKKNLFIAGSILLLGMLFFPGCQKEKKDELTITSESELESRDHHGDNKNECRLTMYKFYDVANDFAQIERFTYTHGRVDEWLPWYGGRFKMEYGHDGTLKISRYYDGETLVNTIYFFYKKGKLHREIWYVGNTTEVEDEGIYSYNHKGEMIKNESLVNDYYVTYTYTHDGNLKSWFFFSAGLPGSKAEYTFKKNVKNPYTHPGIDYSFVFANAGWGTWKQWPSGEKLTYYDENGTPTVIYDNDSRGITWQVNKRNYPIQAEYIDRIAGTPVINTFGYENCEGVDELNDQANSRETQNATANRSNSASGIKSLMNIPKKMVIQWLQEQREKGSE